MDTWGIPGLTRASLAPLATRRHCDEVYTCPALTWPTGKPTRVRTWVVAAAACRNVRTRHASLTAVLLLIAQEASPTATQILVGLTALTPEYANSHEPVLSTSRPHNRTNAKEHRSFCDDYVLLLVKKFPTCYFNSKVHYRVHNSPPLSIPADAHHFCNSISDWLQTNYAMHEDSTSSNSSW